MRDVLYATFYVLRTGCKSAATATFLQWLATHLLGTPARQGAPGESYWRCPFHDDSRPSFHTYPTKPPYRDRWRCFGCGLKGGAADLLKELYPGEDWPRRRVRLEQWRREYDAELAAAGGDMTPEATATPADGPAGFPSPGSGEHGAGRAGAEPRALDPRVISEVWADLTAAEQHLLAVAAALAVSKFVTHATPKISVAAAPWALMLECLDWDRFIAEGDAAHVAECKDPECDAVICRAARGLPPLTPEELRASREAEKPREAAAAAERMAIVRKSIKSYPVPGGGRGGGPNPAARNVWVPPTPRKPKEEG
jgi:hypothetical protein